MKNNSDLDDIEVTTSYDSDDDEDKDLEGILLFRH